MKLRQILFILTILSLNFACSKEKQEKAEPQVCAIDNPLEEIEWLKTIHLAFQQSMMPTASQIIQYEYQGECVYLIENCHNCPDALIVVYNAAQEVICEFGGFGGVNTCPDFEQEASNKIILWGNN